MYEDRQGEVMHKLFHGTRSASMIEKNGFRRSTGGEFGPGIYLTENQHTAEYYAIRVARGEDHPAIVECTAAIHNPYRVTKLDWIKLTERSTPKTVQNRLIKKGHDGIVGIGINGIDEQIVAFKPEQVKFLRVRKIAKGK